MSGIPSETVGAGHSALNQGELMSDISNVGRLHSAEFIEGNTNPLGDGAGLSVVT